MLNTDTKGNEISFHFRFGDIGLVPYLGNSMKIKNTTDGKELSNTVITNYDEHVYEIHRNLKQTGDIYVFTVEEVHIKDLFDVIEDNDLMLWWFIIIIVLIGIVCICYRLHTDEIYTVANNL